MNWKKEQWDIMSALAWRLHLSMTAWWCFIQRKTALPNMRNYAGDFIVEVNGVKLPQDSLDHNEILQLIKGQKGTKVTLTVKPMLSDKVHTVK
jgi:hypothetical protein